MVSNLFSSYSIDFPFPSINLINQTTNTWSTSNNKKIIFVHPLKEAFTFEIQNTPIVASPFK